MLLVALFLKIFARTSQLAVRASRKGWVTRFGSVLLFSVPAALKAVLQKDHQQFGTRFRNFSTMKRVKHPKYVLPGCSFLIAI